MRLAAAISFALVAAATACRSYKYEKHLSDQDGLIPADQYARYGREPAEAVAIGREYAQADPGDRLESRAGAADAAAAYARRMPDVVNVVADTQGYRLTLEFKSRWRVAVNPIADGKRGTETPNLPQGAGAAPAPPAAR